LLFDLFEFSAQLAGGPAHCFFPKIFFGGKVSEQGGMAHPHAIGDGRRGDLVWRDRAGQLNQCLHRMGTPFSRRNGRGAGQKK